jgi:hypothetical protein
MGNIKIVRARSTEEYVSLIEQALDDVWDLRQAIEYDEDMSEALGFIDELEAGLKETYESMKDGSYQFATGDFPFMAIFDKYHEGIIPFKFLLMRINETHMKGLEVES